MAYAEALLYLTIIGLIALAGFVFITGFVDEYVESWENMTPETTSCEIISDSITGNSKKPWYDRVTDSYDRVWNESNCDDITSENWKGDDWIYIAPELTPQERIDQVEREREN